MIRHMPNRRSYGAKKNYEADAIQCVEDGNPSEITDAAFVLAHFKDDMSQAETERIGKWVFHVAEKYIDDTWQNVKRAVEAGKLWKFAKASTAWRSKGGVYVLLVYTHDSGDEKDVMRIRAYLREMGFKRRAPYKTDAQTRAGIYSDNSDGVAKYFA